MSTLACHSELEGTDNLPNYLLQDLVKKSSAAINERIYLHLRASMWSAKFRWKANHWQTFTQREPFYFHVCLAMSTVRHKTLAHKQTARTPNWTYIIEEVALEKYPHWQAKRGHHVHVRCITCNRCAKPRNVSWWSPAENGPDRTLV